MAPTAERKYKLATEQRTVRFSHPRPRPSLLGSASPRPSEHPRPARRRHVASPRGSSSPRLRQRAPDVTLPEFTPFSKLQHPTRTPRAPATLPYRLRSPTRLWNCGRAHNQQPTPRDRLQRAQRSTRGRRAQAPPPGADFLPEPEREMCACARACGRQGTRLRRRFFPKAVGRMRCERPGRRRG